MDVEVRPQAGMSLLRPAEVVKILGIGRTRFYQMVSGGELPVCRIGRSIRVPLAELSQWVQANTEQPEGARDDATE